MGFVVNQIALGQILTEYFCFLVSLSFHQYSTHFFYLPLTVILSVYVLHIYTYLYIQLLIPVLVWRNSPISGLGLLCIACLDLSIKHFCSLVSYAQFLLGILLYCHSPYCFRFSYRSFATDCIVSSCLICVYYPYIECVELTVATSN